MSRYAWVTLVMRDELYACGALVLGQSLRRAGTQADLVCMVTDDIPADVTSALGEVWDHVVCVPRLEARRPVQQRRQVRFGAAYSPWLQSCLTKFCCLQMTRYSKVVFLDADMLCVAAALSPLVPSPSPSPPPSPSTRADEGEEHGVSHGGAEQSEAPVNTRLAGNLIRRKGEKEENESGGEEEEGEEEKEGEEKGKDEGEEEGGEASGLEPASEPHELSPPSSPPSSSSSSAPVGGREGVSGQGRAQGGGDCEGGRGGGRGRAPLPHPPCESVDSLFALRAPAGILDLYRSDVELNGRRHGCVVPPADVKRALEGNYYAMRGKGVGGEGKERRGEGRRGDGKPRMCALAAARWDICFARSLALTLPAPISGAQLSCAAQMSAHEHV